MLRSVVRKEPSEVEERDHTLHLEPWTNFRQLDISPCLDENMVPR